MFVLLNLPDHFVDEAEGRIMETRSSKLRREALRYVCVSMLRFCPRDSKYSKIAWKTKIVIVWEKEIEVLFL